MDKKVWVLQVSSTPAPVLKFGHLDTKCLNVKIKFGENNDQ